MDENKIKELEMQIATLIYELHKVTNQNYLTITELGGNIFTNYTGFVIEDYRN